jgi:DNA-binding CsgD family transcriptional regulator
VGDGILLFDLSGRLLHQNSAASRILAAEAGPDRVRLEHEARLAALGVAALLRGPRGSDGLGAASPPYRQVRGTRCEYRLAGTLLRQAAPGPKPLIAVTVERITPERLSDGALQVRFGLTAREVQVARLLTEGRTDAGIAAVLGVTRHTASRHAEHVRAKLGVRSRAAVATRIGGA